MSIFKPCVNARPTRAMRCECGYGTCVNCSKYVEHKMEHEPTGHAWILTTNKYYKRTAHGPNARYEKGIITFGSTYIMCAYLAPCDRMWTLDVLVDGSFAVKGARCSKIGIAINIGSDAIKHLIAADINRVPKNLRAEQEPRDKPVAVASKTGTPASLIGHEEPPRLGCEKGMFKPITQ